VFRGEGGREREREKEKKGGKEKMKKPEVNMKIIKQRRLQT
jgi:hypothetical protein